MKRSPVKRTIPKRSPQRATNGMTVTKAQTEVDTEVEANQEAKDLIEMTMVPTTKVVATGTPHKATSHISPMMEPDSNPAVVADAQRLEEAIPTVTHQLQQETTEANLVMMVKTGARDAADLSIEEEEVQAGA